MNDEMNGVAYIDKDNILVSSTRNVFTMTVSADDNVIYSDRPFYHGLLMNRQQIQQIIDNRHLFDTGLVNAAFYLVSVADTITMIPRDE